MADNHAAKANFDELKSHIDLAAKRLKALQPGTEAHSQTLEDLEDYYERILQLKKMQADTALEERNETKSAAARLTAILVFVILSLLLLLVVQYAWLAPEDASKIYSTIVVPYFTVDRVVLFLVAFISTVLLALKN